jgi:hypothetical protein
MNLGIVARVALSHAFMFLVVLGPLTRGARAEQKGPNSKRTYSNTAFGFSYVYPTQLVPNTQGFSRTTKASENGYAEGVVLFSAFETPTPGKARDGIVIMYDDVALYGADWDAHHCLRRLTLMQSKLGWTVIRQNTPAEFDGQSFLRADYEHANPVVFQSAVCSIWKGEALQFILSAGSEEEIEQLFQSLNTLHFQRLVRKTVPH